MRVVVVLSSPPHSEGLAAGKAAVALLRGLRAAGAEVRAVAAGWPGTEGFVPPADLEVEVVPVPPEMGGPKTWWPRLHRPRGQQASGAFGARVRELAATADVVFADEIDAVWCGVGLDVPAALHVHYLVRGDRPLGWPWTPGFRTAGEFALAERAAIRHYRHLLASSPIVADDLRRRGRAATVHEIRMGLDADHHGPPAPLHEPVAGLLGTGTWPPTAAAAARLTALWPGIARHVPAARLRIAGRGMAEVVPGAEEVADAADFVRGLAVLAFPLVRGTGVKVKVLEALAGGVPVVTTPAGAEGIVANDGLVVTTDDQAFVDQTVALLRDVEARRQRGTAGRAAIVEHHGPDAVGGIAIDALTKVIG